MSDPSSSELARRITISVPDQVYRQFEEMLSERGFTNRSQAIAEVLQQHVSDYYSLKGNQLMAGTITLMYDHKKPGLKQQLSNIMYTHIDEVITSQQVLLENHHTMEVILVQGHSKTLRSIANKLLACKGVLGGRLNLTRTVMPPIHSASSSERPTESSS